LFNNATGNGLNPAVAALLGEAGIPYLAGMRTALAVLAQWAAYGERRARAAAAPVASALAPHVGAALRRLSVCFARLTQISAIWVVIGVSPPPPAVASTPSAIVGRVGSSRRASRIWRNRSRSQPSPHASTGLRGAPNGGN